MGRHARMKRYKAVDPFNPSKKDEKKRFLKPPKQKDVDLNPTTESKTRKKSKNKFKKRDGETDYRHIQRLNREIQFEIFKASTEPQQEPELRSEKTSTTSERKVKHKERLKTKKQRIREKREEKIKELNEENRWKDEVGFGEVVMAPPVLKHKPRKADKITKQKNNNLLLSKKFKSNDPVSLARQQLLLNERERVIQAYREIKQQKINEQNLSV